jgi:hypothetical protein
MLLGWPDVEIVGITTTIDREGWRAAYFAHCLKLVGREDIPVAVGAPVSLTTGAGERGGPLIVPDPGRVGHIQFSRIISLFGRQDRFMGRPFPSGS